MPGKPEIQNKTNRLVFIPLYQDEKEIASITKKLVIQDETTIHDFLLESLILNLRRHNIIIGGNPNRQLFSFTDEANTVLAKCNCGKTSVYHGLNLKSSREYDFCKKCFGLVSQRHDLKVWRFQTLETKPTGKGAPNQ